MSMFPTIPVEPDTPPGGRKIAGETPPFLSCRFLEDTSLEVTFDTFATHLVMDHMLTAALSNALDLLAEQARFYQVMYEHVTHDGMLELEELLTRHGLIGLRAVGLPDIRATVIDAVGCVALYDNAGKPVEVWPPDKAHAVAVRLRRLITRMVISREMMVAMDEYSPQTAAWFSHMLD